VECSEEGFSQLVVASGDAAKVFDLVEEALDAIALAIKSLVVGKYFQRELRGGITAQRRRGPGARGCGRRHSLVQAADSRTLSASRLSIESFELPAVMGLSLGQVQSHAAIFVDGDRVNLVLSPPRERPRA